MAKPDQPDGRLKPQATTLMDVHAHEPKDVGTRPVIIFFISTLIFLGVIHLIVYGMVKHWAKERKGEKSPEVEMAIAHPQPPPPRLQSNPAADLDRMLSEQKFFLNSYGWVDQRAGIAHIPIDQSIDDLAAHGLPPKRVDNPTTLGQIIQHRVQ